MSRKFADIGSMNKSKEGGYYIKLEDNVQIHITGTNYKGDPIDVTVKGGEYLNLEKPEDKYLKIYKGNEAKAQEVVQKIPEFVKFFVSASQKI